MMSAVIIASIALAVVLSVMGAACFTVLAFLAPITLAICEESKMDKLTGAVAINCGALAGGNFPTAALGVVFRGLVDTAYEADPALAVIHRTESGRAFCLHRTGRTVQRHQPLLFRRQLNSRLLRKRRRKEHAV